MNKLKRIIVFVCFCVLAALVYSEGWAKSRTYIRDTEIESTIRGYATPLMRAANLDPASLRIFLIEDPELNAFVAGGPNIFIHTGLLMQSKNALQVIGVLSHEIGHIAGGHLIKIIGESKDAGVTSILGAIAGGAVAVLGGRPDVGSAIALGGQHLATRELLSFSRQQETIADRLGLQYLERTGQSAKGILEFLEILGDQDLLSHAQQDPYVRTHPLGRERLDTVRHQLERSRFADAPVSREFEIQHTRMRAKLIGFLQRPALTLRQFPASDRSFSARYARAIAYHKMPNPERALTTVDELIRENPKDVYLYDLKGQVLFESGRVAEAMVSYGQAVNLKPDAPLLRVDLARSLIEQQNDNLTRQAIPHLQAALDEEPRNSFAWRQLGIAYGRLNQLGESSLALAEEAVIRGRNQDAIRLAERAQKMLKSGSPDWIRAEDIVNQAKNLQDKR